MGQQSNSTTLGSDSIFLDDTLGAVERRIAASKTYSGYIQYRLEWGLNAHEPYKNATRQLEDKRN